METDIIQQLTEHFEGVVELRQMYHHLDTDINNIANKYNLHCKKGCGACCLGPAINKEASVFELLPMAIDMEAVGIADKFLEKLENIDCENSVCVCYESVNDEKKLGHCGQYKYRPFICRLFGDSLYHIKNDKLDFTGCHWLKNIYQKHSKQLLEQLPIISEPTMQGRSLDETSFDKVTDINSALKEALELVRLKHDLLNDKLEDKYI